MGAVISFTSMPTDPSRQYPATGRGARWVRRWKPVDRYARLALVFTCMGLALRFTIASVTLGTNDAWIWFNFGRSFNDIGLGVYAASPDMIHPPLPLVWSWVSYRLNGTFDVAFCLLMKLPAIFGDVISCWALWKIGVAGAGRRAAMMLVATMALNPAAILISAAHCNTDNLYTAFTLWSLYLAQRQRMLLSGVLLGAAINVKLIPVIFLPVLLLCCRNPREWTAFAGGLVAMLVPFVIVGAATHGESIARIAGYGSAEQNWGVNYVLRLLEANGVASTWASDLRTHYRGGLGKVVLLVSVLTAAFFCRRRGAGPLMAGAISAAIFLVTASGFGVQYVVLPVVLALAVSVRSGLVLGMLGGAFLVATYWAFCAQIDPMYFRFTTFIPPPASYLGLLLWVALAAFAVRALVRTAKTAVE
ncbi:MAG TPA: glycosyltransferase 87 family protein [Tepidisphaeraceae bacterium]